MSQSPPGDAHLHADKDDPMISEREEEGEGDVVMAGDSDDSSEEPEEDAEEERRIREGFIVDEDEDEEDEVTQERRAKRRKRRHRRRREDDDLEEDDLDLLEENTGAPFKKHRRLRRGGRSESPPASSRRKSVVESSESDLDNDDLDLPQVQDIQRIFDDDRLGRDDYDDGDMDDFIEYDEEDEHGTALNEEAREEKRRERRKLEKERRRAALGRPELEGIDANAWDEIHDVFGDGHEYDWALAGEEDPELDEEVKPEMRYQDVFEPTEIKQRHLTEDDDLIRAQDIPERMQLANSSLSKNSSLYLQDRLTETDMDEAALWVAKRISVKKYEDYFLDNGEHTHLQRDLISAVAFTLRCLFLQDFEVPYIWAHKRDDISLFDVHNPQPKNTELLTLPDMWRVYTLGQKYRSLVTRRKALLSSYRRLGVSDDYFDNEVEPRIDGVEVIADATEWLAMKYKAKKQDIAEFHFHDDEEQPDINKKRKMPSRISAYEVAKKSIVSKLAQGFGLQSHHVVLNFLARNMLHFVEDQELNPLAYAEQFSDPTSSNLSPEELLQKARMIIATELGKDPLLRREIRSLFKTEALITVVPTERGINKIDENSSYYNFKYLQDKKADDMLQSAQFLRILAAESELLVNVSIHLPKDVKDDFERKLDDAFQSDNYSDATKAWNEERLRIVQDVLNQHLLPAGSKWMREYIRDESEDFLADRCGVELRKRIDVAPYASPHMAVGETPSVLAISWGKGDPHKDAITMVFMDEEGRLREQTKLDNLLDGDSQDEFKDILKRRRPDLIAIGGFTMATTRLSQDVKKIVRPPPPAPGDGWGEVAPTNEQTFDIPVLYIHDAIARLYVQSKRAAGEFSGLSNSVKYCVGLARYAQSPLAEYAAMGEDMHSIQYDEEDQQMIPKEKLLTSLERTLVDVVNKVGVDINRAITDSYYQHLLPFVCGLGPRKAKVVVQRIAAIGGNLINRDQFIKNGVLTTKLFLNAAGFLRIYQDPDQKLVKNRHADDDVQDPLDGTRIHPEDYELARKMATDALEIDDEDIHDEHPSHVVSLVMQDPEKEKKLNDLNLDDFAVSLLEANNEKKRHTLNVIREELVKPCREKRQPFPLLGEWEVLTMLSGETPHTLRVGFIISVLVLRTKGPFVSVRLDSGIEGIINSQYVSDDDTPSVTKGQTIAGVVIDVKMNLETDSFTVELSSRPTDVQVGDNAFRHVRRDDAWDRALHTRDLEMQARKKRAEMAKTRRVIKHPNFHNFNTVQAEAFLDKQQKGDVIIRPSSKGLNHLAVTWKVEDQLFQHIDVEEPNADPTGQTVGSELIVDKNHHYADLDELIVNHVQAMARRVEELMAHEKFKPGSEDELHLWLKNFVAANPSKSAYGFTLNRKKPGHFSLCFLANKNSSVQTWPIRVAPEAYYLFDAAAAGVPELCDAFKVRHLHESQNAANINTGGKTPYGGRTPGHMSSRTPGHMSARAPAGYMSTRHPARTPNPYSGSNSFGAPTPGHHPHGGAAPTPYAPPPSTYGGSFQAPSFFEPPAPVTGYGSSSYGPPTGYPGQPGQPSYSGPPPPSGPPAGIHPSRLQMLQSEGSGWGR